jgi:hypothetical protein
MTPSPLSTHARFRRTRTLALVALLCVLGVQVLEAGHMHSLGDGSAQCLLCKSTPLLATVAATTLLLVLALAAVKGPVRYRLAVLSPRFHHRRARGPPSDF